MLERQLTIAQERLGAERGAQIVDASLATEAAERDVAFERAVAEIESLKQRLAAAEGHAEQFRRIGATTEGLLKDLRERSAAAKEAQEAEVARLRAEHEGMRKELDGHRSSSLSTLQEVEKAREELLAAKREGSDKVRALEEEAALARQAAEQAAQQAELLKADILKFQTAARNSHANYERELQLHAKAERDLKDAEADLDRTKAALLAAQQAAADLTAASIRTERAAAEEKARAEETLAQQREQSEALRKVNETLHSNVQSLGVQVTRLLESRAAMSADAPAAGAATASASASATATAAAAGDASEEVVELRQQCTELREVVRYMKREKDLLEAKLAVAEGEAARLGTSLAATQRALDEARAELKRELDKRVSVRGEEEFTRLMTEVTQLNLVRESNAHLRHENEELAKRLASTGAELKKVKDASAPLEETARKLRAEKEALEQANAQLVTDTNYWKDRLHQLVSRYNDVDPEEHRLLQGRFDDASKALEAAAAAQAGVESRLAAAEEALAKKDEALTAAKGLNEGMEKNANGLRTKVCTHASYAPHTLE